jgi:hypothetical protein
MKLSSQQFCTDKEPIFYTVKVISELSTKESSFSANYVKNFMHEIRGPSLSLDLRFITVQELTSIVDYSTLIEIQTEGENERRRK